MERFKVENNYMQTLNENNLKSQGVSIQFRCPHCQKLYKTLWSSEDGLEPEFECVQCQSEFSIDMSQHFIPEAERRTAIVPESKPTLNNSPSVIEKLKKCPRCHKENKLTALECGHCQIVFSKIEGLDQFKNFSITPTTLQKWKEILNDLDNKLFHEDFIIHCNKEKVLAFALDRYESLNQAIGQDKGIQTQINLVKELINDQEKHQIQEDLIPIKKILIYAAYFVGGALVSFGLLKTGAKNAFGFGIMLLLMTYGLQQMSKDN